MHRDKVLFNGLGDGSTAFASHATLFSDDRLKQTQTSSLSSQLWENGLPLYSELQSIA